MTPPIIPRALRSERDRWERLARDPYYAVLNVEENRTAQLTDEERAHFGRTGEEDMGRTIGEVRRWLAADFAPRHAIDFGCGVGRLTIPLARTAREVTGIDISRTMLDEAERNAAAGGVGNVRFVLSEDYFASPQAAGERPDFIHAYIVFQHIPPRAGVRMAEALVERLVPGGIGALHFTFARRAPRVRRVVNRLRRLVPGVNALVNLVQRRPLSEPLIPMNQYDLGQLFTMLGDHGCTDVHARLTDHGGHLGAMLLFRKA
jgi:SAM-dependent methyltransferase